MVVAVDADGTLEMEVDGDMDGDVDREVEREVEAGVEEDGGGRVKAGKRRDLGKEVTRARAAEGGRRRARSGTDRRARVNCIGSDAARVKNEF